MLLKVFQDQQKIHLIKWELDLHLFLCLPYMICIIPYQVVVIKVLFLLLFLFKFN